MKERPFLLLKYVLFCQTHMYCFRTEYMRVFFFFHLKKTEPFFKLTNDFSLEASKNTVIIKTNVT